jgi:hypothetical protein
MRMSCAMPWAGFWRRGVASLGQLSSTSLRAGIWSATARAFARSIWASCRPRSSPTWAAPLLDGDLPLDVSIDVEPLDLSWAKLQLDARRNALESSAPTPGPSALSVVLYWPRRAGGDWLLVPK